MIVLERATALVRPAIRGLDFLSPLIDLGIRLWVAAVFWRSGLTKIASWDTTVALFTYEYQVPLLPPGVAALFATVIELGFPPLLAFGLGARFAALVLFVFNALAVLSYPGLSEVGLKDHTYWGILLLVTLLHGPGKLSLDCLIRRWLTR